MSSGYSAASFIAFNSRHDGIADYLSDETGWLVNGFQIQADEHILSQHCALPFKFDGLSGAVCRLTRPEDLIDVCRRDIGLQQEIDDFNVDGFIIDVFLGRPVKILEPLVVLVVAAAVDNKAVHVKIVDFLLQSDIAGRIRYGACKEILTVIGDYDDDYCYGYAALPNQARFQDFKNLLRSCVEYKKDLRWS